MRRNMSLALAVVAPSSSGEGWETAGPPQAASTPAVTTSATTAPVTEEQPTVTLAEPGEAEPTEPLSLDEGIALLEERCTACHSLDRITGAGRTREQGAQTVGRMTGYGAELSTEEREALLDYLAQTYGP